MSKTAPPGGSSELKDPHNRLNLSAFVNDKKVFLTIAEQENARKIYQELVEKEKELNRLLGGIHVQTIPPDFDVQKFAGQTKENSLTKALKQHFDKERNIKAAWDYMTLKHSAEELAKHKKSGDTPAPKDGKTARQAGQGAAGDQGQQGASGGQGQQSQQGASGVEDMEIDRKEDEMFLEEEDIEDFRKSVILSLLIVNHDYFEQKLLAKAQQEYRFYWKLEKELKTKKTDIKPEPFKMEQFRSLSNNRPIHTVISTILDQANETSHAQAAAEEYVKFRSLEKKLNQQFPKELEVSTSDPLIQDVKTRYRTPRMSFRQAAEFKMVPLDEYRQLRKTINHQRDQISELSSRLTGIANQQVAEGEIFTDIGNNNTPRRLGQRFAEIFEEAWSNAYEVLKPKKPDSETKPDEKEETDEKTVDILQKIVKVIYEFCQTTADQQTTFLMNGMIPPIVNPMQGEQKIEIDLKDITEKTEKMAKDYRKAVAPATITALQIAACERIKEEKMLSGEIGKELKEYIDNCVHLIWYMCIQQPPMILVWGEPGKKFNKEMFRFSGKKGQKYRLTVWPAVLFSQDGGLAAAGYAIPE